MRAQSRHAVTLATLITVIAAGLSGVRLPAEQDPPPGFLDPEPILRAAREAIGTDNLRCITIAGTVDYGGMVGQQRHHGYEVDWPRVGPLPNYVRTMNWDAGTMTETFDREPGRTPASWRWGLGWLGGTPIQQETRQHFLVNGTFGWSRDGVDGEPVAARPEDAERWQLDMWINPHGFLKAAQKPGANPRATWRWELGEMGRDGVTVRPERMRIVSITVAGRYRVDATINRENLLQRIHTWVGDPVLGDSNYEHEFTNASYVEVGDGIRFPRGWHHHQGWDDNFQGQSINAGHNAFNGNLADISANGDDCMASVELPASVRDATFPVTVETDELGDGVWLLGGASHNSVAVEFDDFVAVVEAPLSEARSLAVIEEVVRLAPDKPIRFLINTHQHHDHIGGLRTYMHIGATIVTHWKNYEFYARDVLNYAQRTLLPDMVSLWPPTELAEGYQYEVIRENYWLTDNAGSQRMHVSYVHPLRHVEGMLMAYLPNERILIEADIYDPPRPGAPGPREPNADHRSLLRQVTRFGFDVETIVPIHGDPVPWSQFESFAGR